MLVFRAHHNVIGLNIPMHELLFMDRGQTGGNLARNFHRDLWLKPAATFDEVLQSLPFYKLHCIEIAVSTLPKMKHRGNVGVADTSGSSCFPYKAAASRFIADKPGVNHLQGHCASQINVD